MDSPKYQQVMSSMPPLPHSPTDGSPFEIGKSEVAKWLISQPEIQTWLFNRARDLGCIVYDPAAGPGLWRGAVPSAETVEQIARKGGRPPSEWPHKIASLLEKHAPTEGAAMRVDRIMAVAQSELGFDCQATRMYGVLGQLERCGRALRAEGQYRRYYSAPKAVLTEPEIEV